MRTLCIALFVVANSVSAQPRFYIGAVADIRITQFRPTDGHYGGFYYPEATLGGGVGLACTYDLSSRVMLSGFIQPFVLEKAKVEMNEFTGDPDDPLAPTGSTSVLNPWSEFSSTILFKPIKKEAFAVVIGAGFSARWSGTAVSGMVPTANYSHPWNFHLPIQAGTEFLIDGRWRIMCLAEYQLGLREAYHIWERTYRVNSIGLKVITVWAKRDRAAK